MARKYTKMEPLVDIARERHSPRKTYGEIAASCGLEMKQVKKLMDGSKVGRACWQPDTSRAPRDAPIRSRSARKPNSTRS